MRKSRGWCFTLHDWDLFHLDALDSLEVRYMIYGMEICPKTGKEHLQGYLYYEHPKTWLDLKTIDEKFHIEVAKGSPDDNLEYCSKEENYIERGTLPEQGKRLDLAKIKEAVRNGASREEIFELCDYNLQRWKMAEIHMRLLQKKRTQMPKIYWRWGLSGVGKSRWAYDTFKSVYEKDPSHKWWDGYENDECILIDDFDGFWHNGFKGFLNFLDRYPYRGEEKGIHGGGKINSPVIVITSEFPPEHFYNGNDLTQIKRRLHDVLHVTKPGTEVGR